jgi:SagB-type dehydrogenase family enzyme
MTNSLSTARLSTHNGLVRPRPAGKTGGAAAPYKRYDSMVKVPLPADEHATGSLAVLGRLLRWTFGITKVTWDYSSNSLGVSQIPGENPVVHQRRAVASGGARYPIEAYVTASPAGYGAGLYHYDVVHDCLELVRRGDHRPMVTATLSTHHAPAPDLFLVLTAVFWRTTAKYGDFGYRLICQETGGVVAQIGMVASELGLSTRLITHFAGRRLDPLLGLTPAVESVVAIVGVRGPCLSTPPGDDPNGTVARPVTEAPSVASTSPKLFALHLAGTTGSTGTRNALPASSAPPSTARRTTARLLLPAAIPPRPAGWLLQRSSSPSGFGSAAISVEQLAGLLSVIEDHAEDQDTENPAGVSLISAVYLHALRVHDVPNGTYHYERGERALTRVPTRWGTASLTQIGVNRTTMLASAEAAALIVLVGDPLAGLRSMGDAWYRFQQIHAGHALHRVALAAARYGLTARIHSDLATGMTDDALGLTATGYRSLAALLVGTPSHRTPRRTVTAPPREGRTTP